MHSFLTRKYPKHEEYYRKTQFQLQNFARLYVSPTASPDADVQKLQKNDYLYIYLGLKWNQEQMTKRQIYMFISVFDFLFVF